LLALARRGVPVAEKGWTVERYLRYWLSEVVDQERRPATVVTYRRIVERFIVPGLGRVRWMGSVGRMFAGSSTGAGRRFSVAAGATVSRSHCERCR